MSVPNTVHPRLPPVVISALLFGGTVLLFSRAIGFGFINYDDPAYVTDNPYVQGGLSWAGVVWAFTAPADYWHPLTWLSHMLDWQIFGSSASGHHLTSILWHALNAVLAFLLFYRLMGGLWRSAFAGALFAWHPLRVESVVWITERKDVMSGCFFLLTLLAYERYVAARDAGRPAWRNYLLVLVAFTAGLMSKPMLVTLPVLLLLLDFWPFRRMARDRRELSAATHTSAMADKPDTPAGGRSSISSFAHLLFEKLPLFALSGAAAVATVLMQRHAGAFVLDVPVGGRVANALVSLARYLGKFIWPTDLIVCYPHPGSWPTLTVAVASALALGLAGVAWWQRHSRPWIAVGFGWFLITLLPVLGLIQVGFQAMADRYTYLALLGIELALVWSIRGWGARTMRLAAATAAVVILTACAARTWDQAGVWRNSVTLFSHAVRISDRNDVAEDFLASALVAEGRFDEAAVHAERARDMNPRNDQVLVTLAGLSERQGKVDEAMALYRSALALRPDNPQVQCQLGLLELSRGRAQEARNLMTPALRSGPTLREQTRHIARNALDQGDTRVALFLYELLLEADPHDAEAHVARGSLLFRAGDRAGGLAAWHRALELDPRFPGLRERLQHEEGR